MNDILEIVIRSAVVYIAIITGLRILGRQHLGQMTINDFVLVLLISNAVQNAMVGDNTSLIGGLTAGLTAALTLIIINYLLSTLIFQSSEIRKLLSGEQIILIYDGHFQEDNLKKIKITHDEIESIIREHGSEKVDDIHSAIMETDGTISIIPFSEGKKPVILKHHRSKNKKTKV